LQVAEEEHHPQPDAEVQSTHDENEPQTSAGGGGGGGGGTEPLTKDVQLKTESTGSVEQTEFANPQFNLIALRRSPAVMYSKDRDVVK
jgi:hypothetical protein